MRTYDGGTHPGAELAHAVLSQGREPAVVPAAADRAGVLGAFAAALSFPAHFGRNLDALNDCLWDWSERLTGPTTLVWVQAETLDGPTADAVTTILRDTEAASPHLAVVVLR
ncbi:MULTISPECIES: barstar family protein [Arthrobacter]|uniref:Barstar family protein n=2 Tax=Arthrobacter TaxID=1663 RepID=A0ABU9KHC5_9MICC|nr:barstar family protein [Arthrobacter sp. YJM1]MDP5226697.1 barstar family protein [Arthrobacter sp. YJM1]